MSFNICGIVTYLFLFLISNQPEGGFLKKPHNVAVNYLNWKLIKVVYRLCLLMFYFLALLLPYNNLSSLNNKTIFYIYIVHKGAVMSDTQNVTALMF